MTSQYFIDPTTTDFMKDFEAVPYISKIELTTDCQLKCKGCPTGALKPTGLGDMPLDLIEKIVENNWLRSTTYVELMMSGEATLHKHFSEAIDIVKSSGVMVGVSTNLVDPKKIPALCKLDSVTVSMDVFDKVGYENSRPPMKFDRLIHNIKALVEASVPSTLIYLQLLRTEFTEPHFIESIKKAEDFIDSLGKNNVVLRYVSDCFSEVMGRDGAKQTSKMCLTPFNAVVIKNTGTVHPCGYCFTGKEEGLCLGDINIDRLEDIWAGGAVSELREKHRTQINIPPRCLQCADKNRSNHMFQTSLATDIIRHRNGVIIK